LGRAGAWEIIYDFEGKEVATYEWGLGSDLNNRVEAYRFLLQAKNPL